MTEPPSPLLQLKRISKRYPGVLALQDIDFDLLVGELHVVVGENGAGKSTLIKSIAGATFPDEGEILFDGQPVNQLSVAQRKALGIHVIYQELSLIPTMSVMQNIFLGNELTRGPGVGTQFRIRNVGAMRKFSVELLRRLRIEVDPETRVADLPVAQKQLIEIAKAVGFNARVIVMDEPTTSLGPREKERLFGLIGELKARGIGIIFVSHIIEDCIALGDRITVLRDGRHVTTLKRGETGRGRLVQLITGRPISERYPELSSSPGRPLLQVRNLTSGRIFQNVSFDLHEGEILGFAGLVGSGRTDLVRAIMGVDAYDSGTIAVDGEPLRRNRPRAALQRNMALLTEDRKTQGVLPNLDVMTNIAATAMNLSGSEVGRRVTVGGRITRMSAIQAYAVERIAALNIKAHSPRQKIAHLSGGNQQKALLARALAAGARVLILDEPTKGIDAGAKLEIYDILADLVAKGLSVIIVSSETPEVQAICGRILVMNRGRLVADLKREEASIETIVTYATQSIH
jgi:ribose transport system ATP-binding protein